MFSGDLYGFIGIYWDFMALFMGFIRGFLQETLGSNGMKTMQLVDPIRHGYLQENRNHPNTRCPEAMVTCAVSSIICAVP